MSSTELVRQQDEKGRFLPGNTGFGGRPKGSRNKLGEAFIEALHDDFNEHGIAAIQTVRAEKPDQYLKVIASLLPKDINLNVNDGQADLTDDELIERIRSLTEAITPLLPRGTGDVEGAVVKTPGPRQSAKVH